MHPVNKERCQLFSDVLSEGARRYHMVASNVQGRDGELVRDSLNMKLSVILPRLPLRNFPSFRLELVNDIEFAIFENKNAQAEASHVPKSEETQTLLAHALQDHFLFAQLEVVDLTACVGVMKSQECGPGEDIVVQGDRGSTFFVVESGEAEVGVRGSDSDSAS